MLRALLRIWIRNLLFYRHRFTYHFFRNKQYFSKICYIKWTWRSSQPLTFMAQLHRQKGLYNFDRCSKQGVLCYCIMLSTRNDIPSCTATILMRTPKLSSIGRGQCLEVGQCFPQAPGNSALLLTSCRWPLTEMQSQWYGESSFWEVAWLERGDKPGYSPVPIQIKLLGKLWGQISLFSMLWLIKWKLLS